MRRTEGSWRGMIITSSPCRRRLTRGDTRGLQARSARRRRSTTSSSPGDGVVYGTVELSRSAREGRRLECDTVAKQGSRPHVELELPHGRRRTALADRRVECQSGHALREHGDGERHVRRRAERRGRRKGGAAPVRRVPRRGRRRNCLWHHHGQAEELVPRALSAYDRCVRLGRHAAQRQRLDHRRSSVDGAPVLLRELHRRGTSTSRSRGTPERRGCRAHPWGPTARATARSQYTAGGHAVHPRQRAVGVTRRRPEPGCDTPGRWRRRVHPGQQAPTATLRIGSAKSALYSNDAAASVPHDHLRDAGTLGRRRSHGCQSPRRLGCRRDDTVLGRRGDVERSLGHALRDDGADESGRSPRPGATSTPSGADITGSSSSLWLSDDMGANWTRMRRPSGRAAERARRLARRPAHGVRLHGVIGPERDDPGPSSVRATRPHLDADHSAGALPRLRDRARESPAHLRARPDRWEGRHLGVARRRDERSAVPLGGRCAFGTVDDPASPTGQRLRCNGWDIFDPHLSLLARPLPYTEGLFGSP